MIGVVGMLLAGGLAVTTNWSCSTKIDPVVVAEFEVTPLEFRYGLAENHVELAAPIVASKPPRMLAALAGEDHATKNVRLWDAAIKSYGQHFENIPQQIGDCVSWGAANAIRYRHAVQVAQGHQPMRGPPFPPYLYGIARVTYGNRSIPCRSDGAIGAYAAEGFAKFGFITADEAGTPYGGKLAKQWGCDGPPSNLLTIGQKRAGGDVAPVKSGLEMRDAICNGYPVTVASMFGTRTIRERDGRQVATRNDRWAHQMCAIGYDGSLAAGREYVYLINSWGADAHPQPMQNEPPGGFWITLQDADWIARTGDCWAFSDVPGFAADELDFSILN